ncbi:NADP-binding protein [Dacryopinax primogenitus]|uniref:NADP-binding protein n=1 Tax=Dacryopinax primogenitus (strain DJM 731) TaxID=1858805 RepID=M5G1U8_DACPD|nr:NADP-binding protein [Dacryopinax primogenitus]EJU04171.1 NADP-binding protein [Dacryopinax primogenitus]
MSVNLASILYHQWVPLPRVSSFSRPLTGRTVILTGGNVGLGFEAAKHLASLGPARLIIARRSTARGAEAVKKIQEAAKGKVGKVECWEVDEASFASVTAFGDRFEREGGGKLDLLVLNAAVGMYERQETADGWELMLQVNHLSTCLLALRLLPFLSKARADPPPPRIVIVDSGAHRWIKDLPEANTDAPSILKLLSSKENCAEEGKIQNWYPLTKLFNVFFCIELSERLSADSAISMATVNPGFCRSSLARHIRTWGFWFMTVLFARTTEMGSRTLVWTSVTKDLDGKSGKYTENCMVTEPGLFVMSEQGKKARGKVWDDTIEQLSLVDPEVPKIVKQYLRWE